LEAVNVLEVDADSVGCVVEVVEVWSPGDVGFKVSGNEGAGLPGGVGSLRCLRGWGERGGRGGSHSNMWLGLSGGSPEGLNWTGETEPGWQDENGDLPSDVSV
jgi:hypothetical protein